MKIAISTDHAGFEQLRELKIFLEDKGYECVDFGPAQFDANDDYPDFIKPAAEAVASGECERGIIFGGSGQGEAMAANRIKGVRCGIYYGPVIPDSDMGEGAKDGLEIIRLNREHNDANMLSIGARFIGKAAIEEAVALWLDTPFDENQHRHVRRIKKLDL